MDAASVRRTSLKAARWTGSLSTSTPSKSRSVAVKGLTSLQLARGAVEPSRSGRNQYDSRHLRRRAHARRRPNGAESTVHVERRTLDLVEARQIFEKEVERPRPWIDLSTVRVAAQLQRDLSRPVVHGHRLMRQENAGSIRQYTRQGDV